MFIFINQVCSNTYTLINFRKPESWLYSNILKIKVIHLFEFISGAHVTHLCDVVTQIEGCSKKQQAFILLHSRGDDLFTGDVCIKVLR